MSRPNRTNTTDDEFIRLWFEQGCSALRLAQHLGISSRATCSRRRSIEGRRKIKLPTLDDKRPAYNEMRVEEHSAIVKLRLDDGIVLVGSDAHLWPGDLSTMQRAFLAFAKRFRKEGKLMAVIANGDFFDGARISRHPSIGWEHRPTVKQELEAVQDYMGELVKQAGKARTIWVLGNHDLRFEARIANMVPEFESVKGVHLKDHFEQWEPCWRVDINHDIIVRHRELGGEHADFRNVQTAGKTIITGHDHRTGVVHWVNYRGVHWGVRCGFMGDSQLDPQFLHYLEAREPNWHPAFCVLTFKGGRLLWPELVTKHDDGKVEFRGEVISV